MEIRTLDDWPFAVRCLITYGQLVANEKVHAETTGAHVLSGLMLMPSVRKVFESATNDEIDKACSKAMLVSRRGGATTAILSQPIALLLFGTTQAPSTVPRTTASFLSGFLQGSMFLEKAAAALKAKADVIAKALDDPRIELLLTKTESPEATKLSGAMVTGLVTATQMQHQYFTARHVAYGGLIMFDRLLEKLGKPRPTEQVERMKALLERSNTKRGPKSNQLNLHPRLIGAVALGLHIAETESNFDGMLLAACIVGDPEIDFVMQAISAAKEHLKP
jgi:hypothetical protein